jgi:hypothetical protein
MDDVVHAICRDIFEFAIVTCNCYFCFILSSFDTDRFLYKALEVLYIYVEFCFGDGGPWLFWHTNLDSPIILFRHYSFSSVGTLWGTLGFHGTQFEKRVVFYILLTVHLGIILVNNQLDALLQLFISLPNMFRASQCSSSGESIVSIHHLVYITPCRWLSGMSFRPTGQSSTRMIYTRWCIDTIDSPDDEHWDARNM